MNGNSNDGVGNRTGYTDTVFDSVQTMTYDAKNRLTRWQGNVISAKDYAYTYDEIDNRLTDTETGVVRTWTYDASSRLTTMTNGSVTTTFTFDTNGCSSGVNEGGALTTMSYDKENRMVTYADGSGTTASVYNGNGQKVKQGATTLVWDGWDYLGEVNSGTFDCETFTVNSQILAEKRTGTERLDFERTALGSVCTKYDQTNQARAGVQRYKPYGSLEFHDSTLPTWQWVGSWGYRPTGLSWSDCYVRARHYGSQQAQWTTVDPLWPKQPAFQYSPAPIRYHDFYGRELKTDECLESGKGAKMQDCCKGLKNGLSADQKNQILACMRKNPPLTFQQADLDYFLDLITNYCSKPSHNVCATCSDEFEGTPYPCASNPCIEGLWGYATCLPKDRKKPPPTQSRCGLDPIIGTDEYDCCPKALMDKNNCDCRVVICRNPFFDVNPQTLCSVLFHEIAHCRGFGHPGGIHEFKGNGTDVRDMDFIYRLGCCVCRATSRRNNVANTSCGDECDIWDRNS